MWTGAVGHASWRWPGCRQDLHWKAMYSKSKSCKCGFGPPQSIKILSGSPLLRSSSTQIWAKVAKPFETLSVPLLTNLPKQFPMVSKESWDERCKGRFRNLTQIRVIIAETSKGLKSGYHRWIDNPKLPQNHDPFSMTCSQSSSDVKQAIKYHLEHRNNLWSTDQACCIHSLKLEAEGQSPLNMHIRDVLLKLYPLIMAWESSSLDVGVSYECSTI